MTKVSRRLRDHPDSQVSMGSLAFILGDLEDAYEVFQQAVKHGVIYISTPSSHHAIKTWLADLRQLTAGLDGLADQLEACVDADLASQVRKA